jgi:hypothetical protein
VLQVKHGDKIPRPKDPERKNSILYSYEFAGWSREFDVATSDLIICAEYKTTPIPKWEAPTGIVLSPSVWRLLIIGGVSVVLFLVGSATVTVLIIKKQRKRRLGKNAQKKDA